MTGAIRKAFQIAPKEFDPRFYLKPAKEAMKKVVMNRMLAFGQAGQAQKIRQINLKEMSQKYVL